MTNKPKIGIGVLSWHGLCSLEASFVSYQKQAFETLFDEQVLFLPEETKEGRTLGEKFGYNVKGSPQNLGIFGGLKALAENMVSDYILILENDWALIEDFETCKEQIFYGLKLLEDNDVSIVTYQSRRNPGPVLVSLDKYYKYYPNEDASVIQHFLSRMRRIIRPQKALRLTGDAVFSSHDVVKKFPDIFTQYDKGFVGISSKYRRWTNRCFLLERRFFLEVLMRRVDEVESRRRINDFKNVEIELNDNWWRDQDFKIAIAPGLFTHNRLGDRGY